MFKLNRAKPIPFKMPVLQTPESFKGGTFKAGFFNSYAPFIGTSILTILIASFNLVTDWFVYTTIQHMQLDIRFRSQPNDTHLRKLYIALPVIFLSFCILASIIYTAYVIHFVYKLVVFRRRFFDTRDGVHNKEFLIEKHLSEGFVLLLVIFEDLPISILLLLLQTAVSCDCLIVMSSSEFYMCFVSTFISVIWKLGQVVWSSGCCGRRLEYKTGLGISIFRIVTVFFIVCAFIITILNSILIKPGPFRSVISRSYASNNLLFDKIYIESWLEDENVVFMEKMQKMSYYSNDSHSSEISAENTMEESYFNVSLLSDVLTHYNKPIRVYKHCLEQGMNMSGYMNAEDKTLVQNGSNCSMVFEFLYDAHMKTVFYNYGYVLSGGRIDQRCKKGTFNSNYMQNSTGPQSQQEDGGEKSQETGTTQLINPSSVNIHNSNLISGSFNTEIFVHSIMLLSGMTDQNSKPMLHKTCDIKVVKSQRSFNPCTSVRAEQ